VASIIAAASLIVAVMIVVIAVNLTTAIAALAAPVRINIKGFEGNY
jgi:hypothetical protein